MMNKRLFATAGIIVFSLFISQLFFCSNQSSTPDLFNIEEGKWVYDKADLIDKAAEDRINGYLGWFFDNFDIELYAVSVLKLDNLDINTWTNRLFEKWKVGSRTRGNRGLLFVVASSEQKVRLEVGYQLESVYTDMFIGYVESEQLKPFFEEGRIGTGFEATLELIIGRAIDKIKEGEFSPHAKVDIRNEDYLSGGAGVKKDVSIGIIDKPVKLPASEREKKMFAAGATPQQTFSRYLETTRLHIKDPELGIYTKETREFFRNRTVTNAQQDSDRIFDNEVFTLKIKNNYAVIYYPNKDWTYNPFFLKRNPAGWQLDFATMSKTIRFNRSNKWHFVLTDHPYMFAFDEYYIDENGFIFFKHKPRGWLGLSFQRRNGLVKVLEIASDGPAEKAGVKTGDIIVRMNGKSVGELKWKELVNEFKGPVGSTLNLSLKRVGRDGLIDVEVKRGKK